MVTYEEYQAQRYEAASTIFGPHTLEGYIQEFCRLAKDMALGQPSATDAPPPDLLDQQLQGIQPPRFDACPVEWKGKGKEKELCFGRVTKDVGATYIVGQVCIRDVYMV